MKKYLTQLLEDIRNAHREPVHPPKRRIKSFENEFEEIDNYTSGRNIPPILSVQSGLSRDQFPPASKLTDEEIKSVIDAFGEFLLSYHICVDIPDGVPLDRSYELYISTLDQEAWFFSTGTLHMDFCTGYAPDCELKEYCPCRDVWEDELSGNTEEE